MPPGWTRALLVNGCTDTQRRLVLGFGDGLGDGLLVLLGLGVGVLVGTGVL